MWHHKPIKSRRIVLLTTCKIGFFDMYGRIDKMKSVLHSFLSLIFLALSLSNTVNGSTSCRTIQTSTGNTAPSGEYPIWIPRLQDYITVYCEMGLNGGGYTFIRPFDWMKLINSDIESIFTDQTSFLMRVIKSDGSQPHGVLKQLTQHSATLLKLYLNNFGSHWPPANNNILSTPYMYYGFLPNTFTNGITIGVKVNDVEVSFVYNCIIATKRNYFALFANYKELTPSALTSASPWISQFLQQLKQTKSTRMMPSEYFTFMELGFGGNNCGPYTQTDRRPDFADILSASIGFR